MSHTLVGTRKRFFIASIVVAAVTAAVLWWYAMVLTAFDRQIVSVLADIPSAIIICDEQGQVIFVNRGATKLTGFTEDDILHSDLSVIIPAELRAAHKRGMQASAAAFRKLPTPDGPLFRRIEPVQCKDGKLIHVLLTVMVARVDDKIEFFAFMGPWHHISDDTGHIPASRFKD